MVTFHILRVYVSAENPQWPLVALTLFTQPIPQTALPGHRAPETGVLPDFLVFSRSAILKQVSKALHLKMVDARELLFMRLYLQYLPI